MKVAKCSLRVEKLRGNQVEIAVQHNSRTQDDIEKAYFPASADPTRTHLNGHSVNKKIGDIYDENQLLEFLKKSFYKAKKDGKIDKTKRFPRSVVTYKRKNGTKVRVPTSWVREIIVQIGSHGSVEVSPEIYLEIVKFIQKLTGGTVLRYDRHVDETSEHIHILITHWSVKNNNFSNWFKQKNSYELLQEEVNNYVRLLMEPLGVAILPVVKKAESGHDHIPHKLYKRFLELLDVEIGNKKKELNDLDDTLKNAQEQKDILRRILESKIKMTLQEMENECEEATFGIDEVIKKYVEKIKLSRCAAAIAVLEIDQIQTEGTDENTLPKIQE